MLPRHVEQVPGILRLEREPLDLFGILSGWIHRNSNQLGVGGSNKRLTGVARHLHTGSSGMRLLDHRKQVDRAFVCRRLPWNAPQPVADCVDNVRSLNQLQHR